VASKNPRTYMFLSPQVHKKQSLVQEGCFNSKGTNFGNWRKKEPQIMARSNKRTHVCRVGLTTHWTKSFKLNWGLFVEMKLVSTWSWIIPYSLSNHPNWKSNGHDQIIMSSRVELLGKRERGGGGLDMSSFRTTKVWPTHQFKGGVSFHDCTLK
jgi:hypothetical protein